MNARDTRRIVKRLAVKQSNRHPFRYAIPPANESMHATVISQAYQRDMLP